MTTIKNVFSIVIVLFAMNVTAQQSINYKAIIKDGSGNVVANDLIVVQFQILQGVGMTNVYQESHTPTTDANGLIILNISEGGIDSGVFADINWGADDHYLNVQINTGAGLTDMGTTQFMAVPYALSAANAQGLLMLDQGNGIGWRIPNRGFPDQYGPIGLNAVDLSFCTDGVIPRGAMGNYSTAMGWHTIATGDHSTTMGSISSASGLVATAMGSTNASGDYSTSMGKAVGARSYGETAIGVNGTSYTPATDGDIMWNPTDRLFSIGNGASNSAKSNALTVLKNGKIGLGISIPNVKLHITGGSDANLNDGSGYLVLGEESGMNVVLDNNEIMARNNGGTSSLALQVDGGAVYVGGVVVHASDRRLKEDITELPYGLKEVLQLQPKSYYWKNREQKHKSLGLIAQDVQSIINEVVTVKDDKDKTLGISYTELIPVLIKAIQEQNKEHHKNITTLLERIEKLEAVNNQ